MGETIIESFEHRIELPSIALSNDVENLNERANRIAWILTKCGDLVQSLVTFLAGDKDKNGMVATSTPIPPTSNYGVVQTRPLEGQR
jgi:hypothetical protein